MNDIKVGITDDHNLFREGIRMIVSNMEGITVCLEAQDGAELLEQLKTTPVDIVLMDIEMKGMNGMDTLKTLSKWKDAPKIIILSMHNEPRMISHMMELGARGYLPKDVKQEELETALRTVHDQGTYLSEIVSKSLLSNLQNKKSRYAPVLELSAREKEVLALICQELTAQEIGEKLFISERTVEGHRRNLCAKLEVKNTAGLVKKAVLLNLIDVNL